MRIRSCFFLALWLVLGRDLWADVLYSVTDLSTRIGSAASVRDINNDGQVVGNVGNQAYSYNNGQITYLGAFYASEMNDRGQVVGNIYSANDSHAVLYSNGQIIDLGTLGGSHTSADAVNNLGGNGTKHIIRSELSCLHLSQWPNDRHRYIRRQQL